MVSRAKVSHIGSSLSCIDILAVLYSRIASQLHLSSQDVVLVSKGHAAAAVYSVMANCGLLDPSLLKSYCLDGGELGGHVTARPFIELSTGSLGHALPFANGKAFLMKRHQRDYQVFVLLSDGECDEGSNWEAAMFAAHHNLSNLKVLIDRNYLQSLKGTEVTLALEPLEAKWQSFGWSACTINGHDHDALEEFVNRKSDKPSVAICETVKGHGVSFMEGTVAWHYKSPSDEELTRALKEMQSRA
jgi:transketolase